MIGWGMNGQKRFMHGRRTKDVALKTVNNCKFDYDRVKISFILSNITV